MSTPMSPVLEMTQVSKSYGEGPTAVLALEDASLTVLPGELVAIMGPSGSGKSTMLTIAGTLEEPSAGHVLIDGQDTSAMSRSDRARLRRQTIGYVFQDFNLLPGLTAAENVVAPPRARRHSREGSSRCRARRPSKSSVSPTAPTAIPTSCQAVSGNASRSPVRSSETAGCSSRTSPPARSTPSTVRA